MEQRFGQIVKKEWQLGHHRRTKYMHPLSDTPLGDYVKDVRPSAGGVRSPNMQFGFYHDEDNDMHTMTVGSVFRTVFDMSEPTSAYFSQDVELNQNTLYSRKPLEKGLVYLWDHGRYFRLPTKELAEEIRFKLHETEESTFLHPTEVKQRAEKPKSGCPFA